MSENNSGPEAVANIVVRYEGSEKARSIKDAISPDNIEAPPGVKIDVEVEGSMLRLKVECSRGIPTLISTLDDLLSCIQASETAIEEIQ